MPDWLKEILTNPLVITAIGTGFSIPMFNFLAKLIESRVPPPPPVAHPVRDIPEHPLLISAKVHLAEPEQATLVSIAAAVARQEVQLAAVMKVVEAIQDDSLPAIERKVERNMDRAQLINDRLEILLHHAR